MTIKEVFSNPTVKQVIMQIKFPNLFYIESRMEDFEVRIMKEFPESSLVFHRSVLLADIGPEGRLEKIPDQGGVPGKKMWQFKSEKGYVVNVHTDNLAIVSDYHKTYNLGEGDKFRDIIKMVLDAFFETMSIPLVTYVGLRYIDECPVISKDDTVFRSWYNSAFPMDRFSIADASAMEFVTTVKKGHFGLRYAESLKEISKGDYRLVLDFDGQAGRTESRDCLNVLDALHEIISEEYDKTIKEPVKNYMRQKEVRTA
ncbi:MAG: TIGR04255 family protein [Candidatus Thorarchaeota archaeon]|nr:MAG: TIGR04255 family protein [Candidatus Thorarchaeota archaeon]